MIPNKFPKRSAYVGLTNKKPTMSVRTRGVFAFNVGSIRKYNLSSETYAELGFDTNEDKVVVRFTKQRTKDSYKCNRTNTGLILTASCFIDKYKLLVGRYPVEEINSCTVKVKVMRYETVLF